MKKSYFNVVLTLTCLLGFGISARAEDSNKVVVTVQFEFVVAGSKTMPPGTYSISRISQDPRSGLVIRGNDDSALLLPMVVGHASAEHAGLGFEHVGDKYYLSKIDTPAGVYTIETPRAIAKLAQSGERVTVATSGN